MPSRKQRRRRQKLQRHEYEYVVETEDGEEVTLDELRERGETVGSAGRPAKAKGEPTVVDRRGKPIQKPSLERVFRRAGIFGPILLAFVYFTTRDQLTLAGVVLNTAILLAFFMPFSYLVDTLVYRTMMKRAGRDPRTGRKDR